MSERIVLTPDDAVAISRLLDAALPHVELATAQVVAAAHVAEKLLNATSDVVIVLESEDATIA